LYPPLGNRQTFSVQEPDGFVVSSFVPNCHQKKADPSRSLDDDVSGNVEKGIYSARGQEGAPDRLGGMFTKHEIPNPKV
jgi:hypothetical protein